MNSAGASRTRKLLTVLGTAVSVLLLGWVGYRVWAGGVWRRPELWRPAAIGVIVAGAAAYAVACLLLAGGWVILLRHFSGRRLRLRLGTAIYGRSQLAKYLPTNLLHFAGRHVLGRRHGLGHVSLALAAVYEVLGVLAASAVLAVAGMSIYGFDQAVLAVPTVLGVLMAAVVGQGVVGAILQRRRGRKVSDWNGLLKATTGAGACYLVFFLAAGMILWLLTVGLGEAGSLPAAAQVIACFAVAWLAGFVTPGAPGGLGVREAVLAALLADRLGPSTAATAGLALRLVTTLGDVAFFALAVFIGPGQAPTSPAAEAPPTSRP
jgi:hypothetical protein